MPNRFRTQLAHVARKLKSEGAGEAARFVTYRLHEEWNERRLGIRTTGFVSSDALGHDCEDLVGYSPTPYRALHYFLANVAIRPGRDALLDYGCGMGRVLVTAATKPLRRAIGVEISPEMAARARENIRRAGKRLRCEVLVEVVDARSYNVPDDITLVHLFNPFAGDTLVQVVENIRASLRRRPRPLTIIFGNPGRFETLFAGADWLTRRTLRKFYPRFGYGLYECRADGDAA